MKKLLGGVVISALLVAPAMAADLPARMPVKAPPPVVAAVYNWTGCYIGAQAGWTRMRDRQDMTNNIGSFRLIFTQSDGGVVGGGHLGCNYQFNQIVVGVEGDFEGSSVDKSFPIGAPFANTTGTFDVSWQASIRGRLGFAVNNVLFYGTGGAAFVRVKETYCTLIAGACGFFDSVSSNRTGWTAGGGIEYGFTNNWSARVEYRHTRYQDHTNVLNNFLAPPGTSVSRLTDDTVRGAISYRWGGGPVVARY
jgi:outer membrane immunogenic protein